MSGSQSYSVSARLQITGNAEAVLRALGRQLVSLNARIAGTERNLQRLANAFGSLGSLATGASGAAAALDGLRNSVRMASQAASGANRVLDRQEQAMQRNARTAYMLSNAVQQTTRSMTALGAVPPPQPLRRGILAGAGGAARGAGGGADDDRPSRLTRRLRDPSPWDIYHAGRVATGTLGTVIGAGGAEQQAMTMLRAQGVSDAERTAMREAALRMVREVPGANVVEALGAIRESRMALGPSAPIADVLRVAPEVLRTARVSAATGERTTAEGLRPFARFSAITGGFTDEAGERNIERGIEQLRILRDAVIAFSTGPREGIDPREWEGMARQGGIALRRMSPEGQAAMATLIQERSGQRTGTELTAFSEFVVSGIGPRNRLARATEMGLRADSPAQARAATREQSELVDRMLQAGRITENEARMIRDYQIQQGQFRGRGFAAVRPDIYISEVFRGALQRRGITTEERQLDAAEEILPRQTSRRFVMAMLQVREVMEDVLARQMVSNLRATGQDPTDIVLNEGYTNSLANLRAGITNFLTALGNAPSVIALLNETAKAFNDLADWVRGNPGFMEGVVTELRRLVDDARTFAQELNAVVSSINAFINTLKGYRQDFEGFVQRWNRRIDAAREGAEALLPGVTPIVPGTGPAPAGRSNNAISPGLQFAPVPGLGGGGSGIAPLRPGGGIQLQNFQPMPERGDTIVRTAVYLDGREIADVVSRHQGRAAQAPTSAAPRYDSRRAAPLLDGMVTA